MFSFPICTALLDSHGVFSSVCESSSPAHSLVGINSLWIRRVLFISHVIQRRTISLEQNETSWHSYPPSLQSSYPPQPHQFRLQRICAHQNWGPSRHPDHHIAQQGSSDFKSKFPGFRQGSSTAPKSARVPFLPADCSYISRFAKERQRLCNSADICRQPFWELPWILQKHVPHQQRRN